MNVPGLAPQSTFVTSLAWILIVFSSLGVFGALMQNAMVNFVMPDMIATQPGRSPAPPFPMAFFRALALVFLGVAVFITYAAYALLKRRNWARRAFIVMFALGIAWFILWGAAFGLGFGFADFPQRGQAPVPPHMRTMLNLMFVTFGIFAVGMSVLFGWLIKRLRSPAVKAEFSEAAVVT